jgi:hypothetical protein
VRAGSKSVQAPSPWDGAGLALAATSSMARDDTPNACQEWAAMRAFSAAQALECHWIWATTLRFRHQAAGRQEK